MVHEHGGQVYLDGANLNAQVCLLLKLITFHSFVTGNFFQMCPVLQRFFFNFFGSPRQAIQISELWHVRIA